MLFQNIFTNLRNFNFDSNPLVCDPILFPGSNSPSIAKSKVIVFFHRKGRGDKTTILTYLDSPVPEVFPYYYFPFSILVIFRRKRMVQVLDQNCKLWVQIFFMKTWILQVFYQTMFLFAGVLPLVRILTILDHIFGSKGPNTSQTGPFHGCWIRIKQF